LDDTLRATVVQARTNLIGAMDRFAFSKALEAIWTVADAGNKYITDTAPWTLAKKGENERLNEVLYTIYETLRVLGIWTQPFLPNKSLALLTQLNVPADARSFASTAEWGVATEGIQIGTPEVLFPRLDQKKKAAAPAKQPKQPKKKKPAKEAPVTEATDAKATEGPSYIQFEDFIKVEMLSAKILAAEPHPNADRLLKITIDAGEGRDRTVCAGIAAAYKPEELVGKTVILVANLKPRKLRGVISEGMLMAGGEGANVHLITLPGDHPPGTRIS
jgi:methionyl-tRNA synthetase